MFSLSVHLIGNLTLPWCKLSYTVLWNTHTSGHIPTERVQVEEKRNEMLQDEFDHDYTYFLPWRKGESTLINYVQ